MRTWAEISRASLRRNFEAVQQAVGGNVAVAPVVKANAYGHGAVEVSRTLESAGAQWLAVNCAAEGAELRDAGIETRILVMGGVLSDERGTIIQKWLTPVVHSPAELSGWDRLGAGLRVHLMIDSGMNRLGTLPEARDVVSAIRALRHIRVEGLLSHFASAEDLAGAQTSEQTSRFQAIRHAVHEAGIAFEWEHFSSSSGVAYAGERARLSLVRPGLATYGYLSPPEGGEPQGAALALEQVLTWYARLLHVAEIPEGATVGYRARFRAPRAMRVGTVAAGYADGIPHRVSARGSLISQGRALPILGAVSMDLTTVDLTAAPELQVGDAVTVLGPGMDAQHIASLAGEIPYSVLCGIGNRVTRIYV